MNLIEGVKCSFQMKMVTPVDLQVCWLAPTWFLIRMYDGYIGRVTYWFGNGAVIG